MRSLETEIWRPIPGYENIYEVSNLGRVKSLSRKVIRGNKICLLKEKIKKSTKNGHGYFVIKLHKNKKKQMMRLHVLVAMAFLNHKPDGQKIVVDHIDNNKENNTVNNLQLISQRENSTKDRLLPKIGKRGVSKHRKKYRAVISVKSKIIFLGLYKTITDAHNAYEIAAKNILLYDGGDKKFRELIKQKVNNL